jgi:hypothetical protein
LLTLIPTTRAVLICSMNLRLYWPKPQVLDGTWTPPPNPEVPQLVRHSVAHPVESDGLARRCRHERIERKAHPGGRVTPRFRHRLIRFRHSIDGSLALASLNLACRDHVPTFPQRSPPSLLTTAACSGLGSAPDCRPRRALLHLSYSCAPSYRRCS